VEASIEGVAKRCRVELLEKNQAKDNFEVEIYLIII
jgi:hypothetical protein